MSKINKCPARYTIALLHRDVVLKMRPDANDESKYYHTRQAGSKAFGRVLALEETVEDVRAGNPMDPRNRKKETPFSVRRGRSLHDAGKYKMPS